MTPKQRLNLIFCENSSYKACDSVGGNTIALSKTVKFLGVTLDDKLNNNTHIDNVTQKATAALMQCKRAVGPMWGLSPKTCKWIYTS